MKFLFIFLSSLLSLSVHAAILTNSGSKGKIEGVALSSESTTSVENESTKLSQVGAGLLAKKVAFFNVDVYVAEFFVSSAEKFKKADALNSLKDQKAVAVQLHFLRDVEAEKVQTSFKEALQANNVKLDDNSIKQFLEAVSQGGEAKKGKILTILGAKLKDNNEEISYENTSGKVTTIKGSADFIKNIFSIWLGTPADDGIARLKKSVLAE
ncbi:MAG TPA: chalcone isomerase family protein [Bdellovibrio sp.]|nr:chalcone isomerase family protein [Bdellovibrio sp.]